MSDPGDDSRHEESDQFDQFDQFEQFDQDDGLRALLRDVDPARSLPPADPVALARLLEDTMESDPLERTGPTRRPLTWLVGAAAAAVVLTGGVGVATRMAHHHDAPSATHHQTTTPTTPAAPALTRLSAPTVSGRCALVAPEILSAYDTAFQGTVTSISGDTITLQTTSVYHGQVGETVQVAAVADDLGRLDGAPKFRVGGSYLVSADQGQLAICGFSGPAGGRLQSLYGQAFPR